MHLKLSTIQPTIIWRLNVIHIFDQTEAVYCSFIEERSVAQIVRHHDGRV